MQIRIYTMAGLYIHIPFCASRCIYCGFYSSTLSELRGRYVDALCREMEMRRNYVQEPISTVYLGGGTPSQLSQAEVEKLFYYINKVFDVAADAEVTMEMNPDDVTAQADLQVYTQGLTRVSMGAQTFADERLQFLHRRHSARQVGEAVEKLRGVGINNISVDLMFGFPGETLKDWQADIQQALALEVEHISAYSLMFEEGTPLYRMLEQGTVKEIDEELSLQMYELLIDSLTAAGYEHYEISNFARKGFRSRHNSSYWHQIPYLGIGAAAHSFNIESRQWNVADIRKYIKAIEGGEVPAESEKLDADTRYDDLVTTALRTREGIDINKLETKYKNYLFANAQPYLNNGKLALEGSRLHLTRQGLYVSDMIMSDLMKV